MPQQPSDRSAVSWATPAGEKTPAPLAPHHETAAPDSTAAPYATREGEAPAEPRQLRLGAASSQNPVGTSFVIGRTSSDDYAPLYWHDVDLQAWAPLAYRPRPEYHHHWADVHRYDDPCDLHNLVFDVASISDWEVVRLLDEGAGLLGGKRPLRAHCDRCGRKRDRLRATHWPGRWLAEGVDALQPEHLALGDYSFTSNGNLHRANLAFDWLQFRYAEIDGALAGAVGLESLLGAPLVNGGLDHVQGAAGHVYRTAQRIGLHVLLRGVIDPVEDAVGSVRNAGKATPPEVVADAP